MSFRGYHEVAGPDGSGLPEQIARQHARVSERLARVERLVVVLSGKGGVGKSWVTAALALALARRALAVGVLDADLHGPTVARLLGVARAPLAVHPDGVRPAVGRDGVRVISTDLMLDDGKALRWTTSAGAAHVWRGAAEAGVLRELLGDVSWGAADALLVDMPPDEGRLADLVAIVRGGETEEARVPRPAIAALAVTIPTDESARSVARALDRARDAALPVLGIVENMSGYACGRCGAVGPLFPGDAGARLAAAHGLPLLARLPFTAAQPDEVGRALEPVVDVVAAMRARTWIPGGERPT